MSLNLRHDLSKTLSVEHSVMNLRNSFLFLHVYTPHRQSLKHTRIDLSSNLCVNATTDMNQLGIGLVRERKTHRSKETHVDFKLCLICVLTSMDATRTVSGCFTLSTNTCDDLKRNCRLKKYFKKK